MRYVLDKMDLTSSGEGVQPSENDLVGAEASRNRMYGLMADHDWAGAAELARALATRFPLHAQIQREASGVLSAGGAPLDAMPYALRARDLEPDNPEYALHAGVVLNQCGECRAAIDTLVNAWNYSPSEPEVYQQLAHAAAELGQPSRGALLALKAFRLDRENVHRALAAAHALGRVSRWREAAAILQYTSESAPPDPTLHYAMSYYLAQADEWRAALREIDTALLLDGGRAEYHLHRATLLAELGDVETACDVIQRAVDLEPHDLAVKRHAVSLFVQHERLGRALKTGAELLAASPDNKEYASCMRFLLDADAVHSTARDFTAIALAKRANPRQLIVRKTTVGQGLATQGRVIHALVMRDIRSRYGDSRLGFFWALLEPFIHIGVLAIVFQFTMHGSPPLGQSFFLFYYTGVMPYLLLSHLISNCGSAPKSYRSLLQIPHIHPIDLILSKSIVEFFTTAVIFLVFLGLFLLFGVDSVPSAPGRVLAAFAITMLLGIGMGSTVAALSEFSPLADHVVSILVRLLYFASGIFYVPGMMPEWVRDAFSYNPFLHLVDLNRMGFYEFYAPEWVDVGYALLCAIFTLVVGLFAVFAARRHMRVSH